jgi:hypothetical protein
VTLVLTEHIRVLLRAPFELLRARSRVGEALWLYVYLVSHAMKTGHVFRSREHLSRELGAEEVQIDRWIAALVETRLIMLQSKAPYLVIKLCFWPGNGGNSAAHTSEKKPEALQKAEQSNVPVGSSLLLPASKASNAGKQGVDGGLGEGEGLLAEAQAVVALSDVTALRALLSKHSPPQVRDALARVARTPVSQIRKSRFALFRYLLVQSSQFTSHDPDPQNQP